MKIVVISFTDAGASVALRMKKSLGEKYQLQLYTRIQVKKETLAGLVKRHFLEADALVFIGACGIAVRAIAPFVEDKLRDPAVLVVDELGNFVIPILSGHVGGANELARELAERMNLLPVITTATDLNQTFAVDVFAKKNQLGIANRDGIAKVSASLLEGKPVAVLLSPFVGERATLQLCPKNYVIGLGCKKGKSAEEIEAFVRGQVEEFGIRMEAVRAIASIDVKAMEPGILMFAKKFDLPFYTFSAEQLASVEGDFSASSFVKEQVGVDNVCERAALFSLEGEGELLLKKQAKDGMTLAIAARKGRNQSSYEYE